MKVRPDTVDMRGVDKSMINFSEGRLEIGQKNILTASDYNLNSLALEGLIERRTTSRGKTYYYTETLAKQTRFCVTISLREKRIERVRLHWLDSRMKGWDDVSEELMISEYRLLSNLVTKLVGTPPDSRRTATRTWRFNWGQIDVSYEPRSFQADIFMRPRQDCSRRRS